MIAWFARNHVAANLLLLTIVLAGVYSLFNRIPLEIFPSFEADSININVTLRGATPEDVEKAVTIRIEEAIQDLEGIENITSRSREGSSLVKVEVESGYDVKDILADIKSRVDAISTLPADAERPLVSESQWKRAVIDVVVSGIYGEREIREYAEKIYAGLMRIPGITQVELQGVRDYEIAIEISQSRLRQFNLTLDTVSRIIANSSTDISAGNLKSAGGDILLRSKGQAYDRDDFANIVIKTNPDGSFIRLEDIAEISDGFEESPVRTRFNGKQAAFVKVYRIGKQSAIDIGDKVRAYIEEQQALLPEGYQLGFWDDDSQIVRNRLSTLGQSALQGGLLVMLLLSLFLRPSIALWVFIGIPVSFMGSFILMPSFDATLNIMSLFGFILVLGVVVDDAIVTGENVYTHMQKESSPETAAIKGTQEVAVPVTFGVLTTLVAFTPLLFLEGMRGGWFSVIPYVVIPALLFSLIESKFILPAHLKFIKLQVNKKPSLFARFQRAFANGFERMIWKYFKPLLTTALNNKATTLAVFIGVFVIVLSLVMSGVTRFVFFPRIPSETVRMSLEMPTGTAFEVTDRHITRIAEAAAKLQQKYKEPDGTPVIISILSRTGGRGGTTHSGRVQFEILPPEQRITPVTSHQLIREWRRMIGKIPGAETLNFRAEIGRGSDPISVRLAGSDTQQLQLLAEQVKQRLATYPEIFDIADSMSDGKQELQIELTAQGEALGLTRSSLAQQVRQAYFGAQVQRIQRGRDDVRVIVRLPLKERSAISILEQTLIATPDDGQVPLSHVTTLIPGRSPSTINREDRQRVINISGDVDKKTANMTVINADLKTYLQELVAPYPGISYKLQGEAKEQHESLTSLAWGLLFVLFAIYCLLAIPFKSYWQPFVVMGVIPFGILGAILGHWLMGVDLTLLSVLGMLALVGVLVNDSLVLVDYINKKRLEGMALYEAVSTAGAARFRPVMLTSLTTFFGLVPLLFETSTQAQFLIPMAISLGFGILFATFITLILVPVNYSLFELMLGTSESKRTDDFEALASVGQK